MMAIIETTHEQYARLRGSKYAEPVDIPVGCDPLGDAILDSLPHWRDRWAPTDRSGRRWQYTWAAVNAGNVRPGMCVLDAGADDVSLQYYYARQACRVTSMDADAGALARARRAADDQALTDAIDFVRHDLTDPIDGTFDLVVCISVLEHIEDWHAATRNLADAVAPGGRLLITVDVVTPGCTRPYFETTDVLQLVHVVHRAGLGRVGPFRPLTAMPDRPLIQLCGQHADQPLTWAGLVFEREATP